LTDTEKQTEKEEKICFVLKSKTVVITIMLSRSQSLKAFN
jgi:hypothetical protein